MHANRLHWLLIIIMLLVAFAGWAAVTFTGLRGFFDRQKSTGGFVIAQIPPLKHSRVDLSSDVDKPKVTSTTMTPVPTPLGITGNGLQPVHCTVERGWRFYSQSNEDVALHNYFCNKTGGTFVELGALDGVQYSNTKFFEDHRGWRGVLIEGQPDNAALLKMNRKKSITVASGICKEGVGNLTFTGSSGAVGGAVESMSKEFRKSWHGEKSREYQVPCRPIGSILRDAGISHVDFFSLDVEGGEFSVLETMDWSITVTAWIVELDGHDKEKDRRARNILLKHGYVKAGWDIRKFCCMGCDCAVNEVFEQMGQINTMN